MRLAPLATLAAFGLTLSACAVKPTAMDDASIDLRASSDWQTAFGNQQPVTGPIDLNEAIARELSEAHVSPLLAALAALSREEHEQPPLHKSAD